jgi:hypothetical protein
MESITIGPELAKALVAAHKELTNPKFDADNSFFSSRYASLAACRNATIPILAKHGIVLMQDLKTTLFHAGEQVLPASECHTLLIHESGQGVRLGPLILPAKDMTPQALASSSTYARRYSLNAATSIVGDDDDDGNAAQGNVGSDPRTPHERPAAPASTTPPARSDGLPLRPTGNFAYGKKFVNTPWNLMAMSDLEFFSGPQAERTPPVVKDKCKAEIAWRHHENRQLDAMKQQRTTENDLPFDDKIPF